MSFLVSKMIGPAGIQTRYVVCLFGFYQPIGKNLIVILGHSKIMSEARNCRIKNGVAKNIFRVSTSPFPVDTRRFSLVLLYKINSKSQNLHKGF